MTPWERELSSQYQQTADDNRSELLTASGVDIETEKRQADNQAATSGLLLIAGTIFVIWLAAKKPKRKRK